MLLRCNTATHCNTLQRTATHCNKLQHSSTAHSLSRTYNTATQPTSLQHTAAHCNTLQHIATLFDDALSLTNVTAIFDSELLLFSHEGTQPFLSRTYTAIFDSELCSPAATVRSPRWLCTFVRESASHSVCCSVLKCVAVRCSVLQCATVCCSVLQCVAVFRFVGESALSHCVAV